MARILKILTILIPLIATLMYISPLFATNIFVLLDFFTSFSTFTNDWYRNYHLSLIDQLPEIEPMELYEIPLNELSHDELKLRSKSFTEPVVIRNALTENDVLKKWNNISWWIENYGDEEVICKYVESGTDEKSCTIAEALSPSDPSKRLYVSGEARLFLRRPELGEMVKTDLV